eukprot:TRINITY_DN1388_c0_g1_i2.p1 TRINITY_DN1388_c0_g1~~TRINITY_DN1388_c0_g1_i2.p1  ORF type:complete len:221 (-),score=51.94 TRINITY_DN1388_c0_g1_i2:57-719(-)
MLISSTGSPGKWILPAGTMELGEKPTDAAVRETEEEAGVTGKVLCSLGEVNDTSKKVHTHFYAMEVDDHQLLYMEHQFREREWFPLKSALEELAWRPMSQNILMTYLDRRLEIRRNRLKQMKRERKAQKKMLKAEKKYKEISKKNFGYLKQIAEVHEEKGEISAKAYVNKKFAKNEQNNPMFWDNVVNRVGVCNEDISTKDQCLLNIVESFPSGTKFSKL